MCAMDRRKQMGRWLALRERRGLTFAELSARTGVPVPTLSWWSGKLRREAASRPTFVELVPRDAPKPAGRIEIVLRNERRLIVGADLDPEALAQLASALDP
jgi:transcriptional regulator with XRE-family HTH domain